MSDSNDRLCPHACPTRICIVCGAGSECGLHAPGPDGQPDPTAPIVCSFDATYGELCEMLRTERGRLATLRRQLATLDELHERARRRSTRANMLTFQNLWDAWYLWRAETLEAIAVEERKGIGTGP